MTCTETQVFVDAFIDGELDLARSIELERHLADCAACSALCEARKAAHFSLSDPALRHAAPAPLRKRIHAALAAEDRRTQPDQPSWFRWPWPAAAAGVLAGLASLIFILRMPPTSDPLEREVVDSHIRSLMPNHLIDVPSSDQHTVKPWFAGKVDFSPSVKDLSPEGFPLIGGRVDYVDRHSAAVLVYQRNQHVINVFEWAAAASGDRSPRSRANQGYNMIEMAHAGMEYWIVSDLNPLELRHFADLLAN